MSWSPQTHMGIRSRNSGTSHPASRRNREVYGMFMHFTQSCLQETSSIKMGLKNSGSALETPRLPRLPRLPRPHGALICFMICCWLLIFSRTCATLRDAPCPIRVALTCFIINHHRNWAQLLAPDRSCPASRSLGVHKCSWGC